MAIDSAVLADIRLLIADVGTPPLITDGQIEGAYDAESGSNLLAAARLLEAIAVSEVLVSKKIRTQDLTTDGAAVSAELRALARQFRDRARDEDDAWDGFDVVSTVAHGRRRPEHTNDTVWGL